MVYFWTVMSSFMMLIKQEYLKKLRRCSGGLFDSKQNFTSKRTVSSLVFWITSTNSFVPSDKKSTFLAEEKFWAEMESNEIDMKHTPIALQKLNKQVS